MIVDNTCMQLVLDPEQFDVIVTTNLFGDVISDLCAGLVGGLGWPGRQHRCRCGDLRGRTRIGAGHAGKGVANPGALVLAAGMMLDHLGMPSRASASAVPCVTRSPLATASRAIWRQRRHCCLHPSPDRPPVSLIGALVVDFWVLGLA